ncbi:hypothetical protein GRF29_1g3246263 [Pseudopithomyces chartarum]|uniref:Mid2 domain-containing protein n=1 Tax=Pseudopithomyces chartarum TaxID=1892770 RepID=A0AAN6M7X2_9PLEO|nr:hypothetical protein GRF29_1g3246263 [Pseudopithomyces chartarum]
MASGSTLTLPLTTTFTAPAQCSQTPYVVLAEASEPYGTQWFKVGGDSGNGDATCFPPAFPFSATSIVYSPGICPAGWTSACETQVTIDNSAQNILMLDIKINVMCAFAWLAYLGNYWDTAINPSAPSISSMYQRHIMIVTSTTTTSSAELSSQTSTSSSTPSNTAPSTGPSTTPSATDTPDGTGNALSKGAIAGIAVGAVAGASVIALLAYIAWVMRKRHKNQSGYQAPAVGYVQSPPKPMYSPDPGYMHSPPQQHYSMHPSELPERS